jgi:hypothetical protein
MPIPLLIDFLGALASMRRPRISLGWLLVMTLRYYVSRQTVLHR